MEAAEYQRAFKGQANRYEEYTGHYKRREWRGFDTFVDYKYWLLNWGSLIGLVLKCPVKVVKAVFRYRWMWSLLLSFSTLDKFKEGQRKTALKVSNMNYREIVISLVGILHKLFTVPSDKAIQYDLNQIPLIFEGIKGFTAITPGLPAVYVPSIMDQMLCRTYIDVTETYGVPADVCPLPQSEAGCAIEDDLIKKGICAVATNMPCDGSIMASSFTERRLNLPTYPLTSPLRYNDPGAIEYMVEDFKALIQFLEEQTGVEYDDDRLFKAMKRMNQQNDLLLQKWELNKTDYPQLCGPSNWLYRVWVYSGIGFTEERFLKNDIKTLKLMQKAVKNKEKQHPQQRFRAVIWSTPCNYYAGLSTWLLNCWGVVTVFSMLGDSGSHEQYDLTNRDTALHGLAKMYTTATMRKQTKGGHKNNLEELWNKVEEYNADIVFLHDHLACKGMAGLKTMFEEQADEKSIKLCTVPQDLIDSRTVSRRDMREKINNFMINVMRVEPLDPTLVDFDDTLGH